MGRGRETGIGIHATSGMVPRKQSHAYLGFGKELHTLRGVRQSDSAPAHAWFQQSSTEARSQTLGPARPAHLHLQRRPHHLAKFDEVRHHTSRGVHCAQHGQRRTCVCRAHAEHRARVDLLQQARPAGRQARQAGQAGRPGRQAGEVQGGCGVARSNQADSGLCTSSESPTRHGSQAGSQAVLKCRGQQHRACSNAKGFAHNTRNAMACTAGPYQPLPAARKTLRPEPSTSACPGIRLPACCADVLS